MRYKLAAALLVTVFGAIVYFVQPGGPTTSIDLAWMDTMTRSTDEGVTRSLAPVTVRVYRAWGSPDGVETTFENLEFRVPQAYTLTSGMPELDLDSRQGWGDLTLHVHRPSGRPSILFDDFVNGRLRWVPPSDEQGRPRPDLHDFPPYPTDHYFLTIAGRRPYTSGFGRSEWQRLSGIGFHTASDEWPHAIGRGEVCGWQAYDHGDRRLTVPRPANVHDIYFDTINPVEWRRTIECGPDTYSFCRLSTRYQQFGLTISFSPRNICNWREIEDSAKQLLDRLLVAHNPPTRRWSDPEQRGGQEVEWTNANLNNPNIERDARDE